MSRKKTNLSRNTRTAMFKKLAQKKRRLEEANRQVILMVAGTPESSQLSGEYHAGYLAAQTATETYEQTRQKLQEQVDDQEIIKSDEMIAVKNASRIENVRTMKLQGQSFSSRNICDTKNVSECDLAIDNGSHGLVTRGQMNNQSRFCKVIKSKEDTLRMFCSKDRARKDLLARNMNPQFEMMNLRVTNATKTPSGIIIRPTYVSSVLNTKLLLVTSPSNSTRPKIPNDKLKTCETKTQNTINSGKQTKSQVSSLELTSGKAEDSTMSSQNKKNLLGNSSKTYRKEPLIYRDFQNISTRGTGFQNLPQSTSEAVFRNDTHIYNQSEQEVNNEKKSFSNKKSILIDSKKMESERNKIGGMHNPNKSNDADDGDLNANFLRSRGKQEKLQKSVTYLTKENEYFERIHKMHLHNNIRKNELTKMQSRNSRSTSQPPTVHMIRNIKPQKSSNYVQSSSTKDVKLEDITNFNLQKPRILYTAEPNEEKNKTHSAPLFYHLFNTDKSAVLPNYKFQQPLLYRQSGTATARRSGDVRGRYKLIVPKQIIVHSGKTADRTQADHVSRSTVHSNDARKFQKSLKVPNFVPFRPYQQQNFQVQSSRPESVGHAQKYQNLSKVPSFDPFRPRLQQNYQVQYNTGRFGIGTQKHQNLKTLKVSNFGLISTSQKQRYQVQPNIANTEKNSDKDTTKTSILKIQDYKPDTSNQRKSEAADSVKRKKLSDNPESNQNITHKSNASDQRISGSNSTVKRREFSASAHDTQYGNNKQNASNKRTFNDSDTVKSHKLTVNRENNMIKSQTLSATLQNTQYENNDRYVSDQHDSEATGTIKGQKLSGIPQNNHKKQQEENTDSYKIKAAKEAFTKISELLSNISEMLSIEFECPRELELSLPAWKAELELCMVSAEKIKAAISQQENEKETTYLR